MSMRAEFEKWYSQEGEYSGLPLDLFDEDGDYVDDFVQSMWMAWQAARAQGGRGAEAVEFEDYDPGPLNDWGGGNVAWWMEYIRTEIERANEHWREQLESLPLYTQPQPAVPEGLIEAISALDPDDDMFGVDFQDEMSTYACRYCDFEMEFFGAMQEAVEHINHDKDCPIQKLRTILSTLTTLQVDR